MVTTYAQEGNTNNLREKIRVEGIAKAQELGYKPVIITLGSNGAICLLPGSEFTEVEGKFVLAGGELVVNADEKPQTVLGATLKQGEFGAVGKDGKCNKLPGVLGAAGSGKTGAATAGEESSKITVKGILVDPEGKPVKGTTIAVYEGDAQGYKLKTKPYDGKTGMNVIVNPSGDSGAAGEFTIEWERSLFEDAQDFVILAKMKPIQFRKTGKPTVLKIDSKSKDIDLGEVTWAK